jgi:hypothetical protein
MPGLPLQFPEMDARMVPDICVDPVPFRVGKDIPGTYLPEPQHDSPPDTPEQEKIERPYEHRRDEIRRMQDDDLWRQLPEGDCFGGSGLDPKERDIHQFED